jgi:hypothetical protein
MRALHELDSVTKWPSAESAEYKTISFAPTGCTDLSEHISEHSANDLAALYCKDWLKPLDKEKILADAVSALQVEVFRGNN